LASGYHFSNEGEISWCEFVEAIQKIGSFDCKVVGIPCFELSNSAQRPEYSLLIKVKLVLFLEYMFPDYKESLRKCMGMRGGK
jgi:dTDP-4-dehydrorhamnose reductase